MLKENQNFKHHTNNTFSVLVGMLIGGLAGAVTMLLMAPHSGKDTRILLHEKGIELRDRTNEFVDGTLAKVRLDGNRITMDGRRKAKDLLQQGQALVVEQLDNISDAAQAGKKAIQSSQV